LNDNDVLELAGFCCAWAQTGDGLNANVATGIKLKHIVLDTPEESLDALIDVPSNANRCG
jgi:hypothetical protein